MALERCWLLVQGPAKSFPTNAASLNQTSTMAQHQQMGTRAWLTISLRACAKILREAI